MHKGARMLLIEQKLERVYHLRLAQADHQYYENEIRRLESQLETIFPPVPVTPEQAAQNRRELAAALGLKPKRR
jgi:hypothetical protein